jgi:hypothetical protein
MIAANSRYADSALVTLPGPSGSNVIVITPGQAVPYTFKYVYYITKATDRIDEIANAYFSDPSQWYRIGDANPQIMDWSDIPPGTIIRIPS